MPVESGPSQEEAILDEDWEGDPEAGDDSEVRDACSQELFSTVEEPSQSQQSDLVEAQTGEQALSQNSPQESSASYTNECYTEEARSVCGGVLCNCEAYFRSSLKSHLWAEFL
ncbi:hypothetical protein UY3_17200 [Chelonia mydas]|uniref:Uncharacterized protein n=1 Tax=Chelonia mydas TaxID=8469 RepID=M7AMI1_CHEMY|nr:hypothetical protein UY3_17200 [Chelonia mydas]